MGATDLIKDIVSPEANEQVRLLTADLKAARDEMAATLKTASDLNKQLASIRSIPDFSKAAAANAASAEKVNQALLKTQLAAAKLEAQNRRNEQQSIRNRAEESKAEQQAIRTAQAQDRAAKAAERQAAAAARLASPYQQLVKQLREAEAAAADIGVTMGTSSRQFMDATRNVTDLRARVEAVDAPLGRMSNTLGATLNKAFSGLRTIAYIVPGLGLAGIFGIIIEGLTKIYESTNKGNVAAKAAFELNMKVADSYAEQATKVSLLEKEVKSGNLTHERSLEIIDELNKISPKYFGNLKTEEDLYKRLPSALKNYNEALMLSVRVQAEASLIGEKYKDSLKKQLEIQDNQRKNSEESKQAVKQTRTDANDFAAAGELFMLAYRKIANSFKKDNIEDARKSISYLTDQYIKDSKKLQQAGGGPDGKGAKLAQDQVEQAIEWQKTLLQRTMDGNQRIVDDDKLSYTKRRAAMRTFYINQLALIKTNEQQALMDNKLSAQERMNITAKSTSELLAAQADYQKNLKGLNLSASKDRTAAIDSEVDKQRSAAKRVYENEANSYNVRIKAIDIYTKTSKRLINDSYNLQIADAGENYDKIRELNNKRRKELLDVDTEATNQKQTITKQVQQKEQEELTKIYNTQIARAKEKDKLTLGNLKATNEQQLTELEKQKNDVLESYAEQYSKGKINEKQYQAAITEVETNAVAERLRIQSSYIQTIIDLKKAAGHDTSSEEAALAVVLKSIDDNLTAHRLKNFKRLGDAQQQLKDLQLRLASEVNTLLVTIVNSTFDSQIKKVDKEKELLDKQTQQQLDANDRSLGSTADKAEREALIKAKAAAQDEVLAAKKRKIAHDQAVFEKAASIASIVANTGIAAIAALRPPPVGLGPVLGIPLALTIGAIGAVQVATVLAQPLPEYAHGGKTDHDGLIKTGERGTELRIDPDGSLSLTPDVPNVSYARAGTQIISNDELMKMLSQPNTEHRLISASGREISLSPLMHQQAKEHQEIKSLLKDLQPSRGTSYFEQRYRSKQHSNHLAQKRQYLGR